jgi:K+-transporting ATPase c subunit
MKKVLSAAILTIFILSLSGLALTQTVYTGLIFDAQNLTFTPSASVKILDEDGREVYGSAYVSKDWAEKQGIVSYVKDLAQAKANQRVAGNPLVIKAIKVTGPNNKDLVISNDDARRVRDLAKNLNFLDAAKVVIIVP